MEEKLNEMHLNPDPAASNSRSTGEMSDTIEEFGDGKFGEHPRNLNVKID